ncbi:hypothetical protein [Silvanigrella sp.]|uniref:hypothetical protein n=1 Tax=Silvanigrella sp. TaxID=2024976 RepID=UPI0037C9126B
MNLSLFNNNGNKEEYYLNEENNFFETKLGNSKTISYKKTENQQSKIFSLVLNFKHDNTISLNLSNKESINNKILYELVVSNSDGIKITSFPTNSDYAYFIIKNMNKNVIIFHNTKVINNKIEIKNKSDITLNENFDRIKNIQNCQINIKIGEGKECILFIKNKLDKMGTHGDKIELSFRTLIHNSPAIIKYMIHVYIEKHLFITGNYDNPCKDGKSKWDGDYLSCYHNEFHDFFDFDEDKNIFPFIDNNIKKATYISDSIEYTFYQRFNDPVKYFLFIQKIENLNNKTEKEIIFTKADNKKPIVDLKLKSNWKFMKENIFDQNKIVIYSEHINLSSTNNDKINNYFYFKLNNNNNNEDNYNNYDPNFYEIIKIPFSENEKIYLKLRAFIKCNPSLFDIKSYRSSYDCLYFDNKKNHPNLNLIFEPHENEELINLEVNKDYTAKLKFDIIHSSDTQKKGEIHFEFNIRKDENNILYLEKNYKVSETI